MSRRVVVTGLGVSASVGTGVPRFWNNLIEGRSGIGPITAFDASKLRSRIAGEVHDLEAKARLSAKVIKRTARLHAARAGRRGRGHHRGGPPEGDARENVAVVVGSGIGGLRHARARAPDLPDARARPVRAARRADDHPQHGGRNDRDRDRVSRPQPVPEHRMREWCPLDRHRARPDPPGPLRRRRRRRRRVHDLAVRGRRLLPAPRAVDAQRRTREGLTPVRAPTATASSSPRAPASSCSRAWTTRRDAAPRSWPRSPATA